jgi:hypothetical protein
MISDRQGTKALKANYTEPQQMHHITAFNGATSQIDKLEQATTIMLDMHLKSGQV